MRLVGQLTDDVLVVSGRPSAFSDLPARLVRDAWPDGGALGGLYSGLLVAKYEYCLAVGCDMPFLDLALLRYMAAIARNFDVLVPRLEGYLEPLHAIYSRRCLDFIRDQLATGDRRIVGFYDRVRTRYLDRPELESVDADLLSLFNINTPEQLRFARRVASRKERAKASGGSRDS